MRIKVVDLGNNETLYENIEAEDFLYEQFNEELENELAFLEASKVGEKIVFIGDDTDFEIEKLEDENIYDDLTF